MIKDLLISFLFTLVASLAIALFIEWLKARFSKRRLRVKINSAETVDHSVLLNLSLRNTGREGLVFKDCFVGDLTVSIADYDIRFIEPIEGSVRPVCELEDGGAKLEWELLNPKEEILLFIRAERKDGSLPDASACAKQLSFKFRSDCLDSFDYDYPQPESPQVPEMVRAGRGDLALRGKIMRRAVFFMGLAAVGTLVYSYLTQNVLRYEVIYEGKTYRSSYVDFNVFDDSLHLSSEDGNVRIPLSEFRSIEKMRPEGYGAPRWFYIFGAIVVMVASVLCMTAGLRLFILEEKMRRGKKIPLKAYSRISWQLRNSVIL